MWMPRHAEPPRGGWVVLQACASLPGPVRTIRRKSPGKPVSRAESGQARCIGASARSARGAQVLVDGFAADAELMGQGCLRGTVAGPLTQFGHLLLAEGPPAAAVGAAFLG